MEGVLVTAKKSGSTIAIAVYSDAQGRYRFPSAKLSPGQYAINIRAVGYDVESPARVDISARNVATADLKLHKAADPSMQLTNAEWIVSVPGTQEHKQYLTMLVFTWIQCHGTRGCLSKAVGHIPQLCFLPGYCPTECLSLHLLTSWSNV